MVLLKVSTLALFCFYQNLTDNRKNIIFQVIK
jgi:hypothetical protein